MDENEIPIELCRLCRHYNGHICVLQDLAPCEFVLDKKRASEERASEKARNILLAGVVVFALILSTLAVVVSCTARREQPKPEHRWSTIELLKEYHGEPDTLTEWNELIMAIALTESHFDPNAVGANDDFGCLQITPVFVEEVNRVSGCNYSHEDAFDIGKSVEMFNLLQDYHNPKHDIDKAIALHNRSAAYKAKVTENYKLIQRYEKVRGELLKTYQ